MAVITQAFKAIALTAVLYGAYTYSREVQDWALAWTIQLVYWSPWAIAAYIISLLLYPIFQEQLQPYVLLTEPLRMWIYWELSKQIRAYLKNSNEGLFKTIRYLTADNDPTLVENIPHILPPDPGPLHMFHRIDIVTSLIQDQLKDWNDIIPLTRQVRLTRFHSHEGTFDQPNFLIQVLENNMDRAMDRSGSMGHALEAAEQQLALEEAMAAEAEANPPEHAPNAQLRELKKELRALEMLANMTAPEAARRVQPYIEPQVATPHGRVQRSELVAVIVVHENPVVMYKNLHDEAHKQLLEARRNWTRGKDLPNEKDILNYEKHVTPLALKVLAGTGARFTWITDGSSWLLIKLNGELVTRGEQRQVPYAWQNRPHPNGPLHDPEMPEFLPGPKSAQNSVDVTWAFGKREAEGNIAAAMMNSIKDALSCCNYSTLVPTKEVLKLFAVYQKVAKLEKELSRPTPPLAERQRLLALEYQELAKLRARQDNTRRTQQMRLIDRRLNQLNQEFRALAASRRR